MSFPLRVTLGEKIKEMTDIFFSFFGFLLRCLKSKVTQPAKLIKTGGRSRKRQPLVYGCRLSYYALGNVPGRLPINLVLNVSRKRDFHCIVYPIGKLNY